MTFDTNCSILPYAQTSYTFLLLKLPVVLSKVTGNDDILILWIEIFPPRINHFFDWEKVDISFFMETKRVTRAGLILENTISLNQ